VKAGFIQFAPQFANREFNLKRAAELIDMSAADLLVLPELFSSGYYFSSLDELKELRDRINRHGFPHFIGKHLSMGMTDDFEIAIEEGATIVRIGRAIFGERRK